jgi:hypothetical protein
VLARPKGFEPLTSAFGGKTPLDRIVKIDIQVDYRLYGLKSLLLSATGVSCS